MKTQTSFRGEKGHAVFKISLAVFGMVLVAAYGNAQSVTLANNGSTATVNLGGPGTIGMNNWSVDTGSGMQNQLNQQWFWYSVNGGTTVSSIDALGGLTYSTNAAGSSLSATYQNSTLAVVITYNLSGSGLGSGGADLTEAIQVFNVGSTTINSLNFYQFSNFNLLQNNLNTIGIGGWPGAYTSISQTTSAGANGIEETIDTPYANYAEAGPAGSGNGTVLGDVISGNPLNGTIAYGPGDVAWAFEWNSSLAAGGEFDITKDKNLSIQIVPEPTSMALIAVGLGVGGFVGRRAWKRNS